MSALFEGDFNARCVKAEFGTNQKSNKPSVRATMEIIDGPRAGTQVPYEGNFKQESIAYTKRDLMALGWQGKTMASFVSDVTTNAKIVPIRVRIASYQDPETGKTKQWISVGSIGYSAPPLAAPTEDLTRNVDSWFAEVEDAPQRSQTRGGHPNAPGNDSDIPFASADIGHEPSPIASVLRRSI